MKYEGWVIGARIKELRIKKGMTLDELGSRLEISFSHIRQIEIGSRKMSIDLLYKILDVLEIDANTLLGIDLCHESRTSIDEALESLNGQQQAYFRTIFLQMIQKFPT